MNYINKIPYEIIEYISIYLDNKSLVNFISSNRFCNRIDNNLFWKQKCKKDYNINTTKKIKSWKKKYIILYKNNCINCYKKTKVYNEFFYQMICRSCEKNNLKYNCISQSKVKKYYFLTAKDLILIKYINRNNPFNSKHPLKLYLKTDIIDYIENNYGYYNYTNLRNKKINIRSAKSIAFLTKFNILNSILVLKYNVDLNNILVDINKYTNNLYIKYLKKSNTGSCDSDNLIKACLELDFIFKYTQLDWANFNDFDDLLTYHILSTKIVLPLNINEYIDYKILTVMKNNKDKIQRKHKIICELPQFSLELPLIHDYIINNTDLNMVKSMIVLENFLFEHADLENQIMSNIINNITYKRSELYLFLLKKWYKENIPDRHVLPYRLSILLN